MADAAGAADEPPPAAEEPPAAETEPKTEPEPEPEAEAEGADAAAAEDAGADAPASAEAAAGDEDETVAAAKIQSMHRGKVARKELKQQGDAATRIQANFRGRVVRSGGGGGGGAGAEGAEGVGEEEPHEIEVPAAESLGLEGSEAETAAAAKIQSMHRGKAARQELSEQKQAATRIQAIQRGKKARAEVTQIAGATKVQFVILPENFTYELECPAGATWGQAKEAMEADLTIKRGNMRIRMGEREIVDDSVTLTADGVVSGMQLELEVVYSEEAGGALDPAQGDVMLVTVERGDHPPVSVKVLVDKSELKPKPYMGGYRNKKTEVEYHHAFTQTPPDAAMIARAEEAAKKVLTERTTQTVVAKSCSVNTNRESSTQMNPPYLPLLVDESKDKVMEPRPYFTADQLWQLKADKTLVIQCHVRGWFARRVAAELRRQLKAQQEFIQQQAAARAEEAEEKRRQEIQRRMHPRTAADIEVLHTELEAWRVKETKRIHEDLELTKEQRQGELEVLLGKETQLLQTIDRLKISASKENKKETTTAKIDAMAEAKLWALSDGDAVRTGSSLCPPTPSYGFDWGLSM
jgi:hypothetical protein